MKLPFVKPWESAIAVLHDNIHGQKTEAWAKSFSDLRDELNELPALTPEAQQRFEPRFLLTLPVHHRIKARGVSGWIPTKSIDISQNGIRLAVEESIPVGTNLELDMKLPNYRKPIRLNGLVVWERPAMNGSGYECGVAFENFSHKVSIKGKMINFMADKLCGLALRQSQSMTCRPATTKEDLQDAYHLVYEEYLRRKLCKEDASTLQYNFFCMLPGSRTFLLEIEGEVVGTISVIIDSPCGIPMETLFPDKVGQFRQKGRHIAEVCLLALDKKHFGNKSFLMTDLRKLSGAFKLFKMVFDYARFKVGATDLFIAMHPKHRDLYQYLMFDAAGPVRSYHRVEGKSVLPMRMEVERFVLTLPKQLSVYKYFLEERISPEVLENHFVWDTTSAREFLFHQRNLWSHLEPHQQAYLKILYPNLV